MPFGFFYGVYNCGNDAVQVAVTGANPFNATVVTHAKGNATFTYTGQNAGSDRATATEADKLDRETLVLIGLGPLVTGFMYKPAPPPFGGLTTT